MALDPSRPVFLGLILTSEFWLLYSLNSQRQETGGPSANYSPAGGSSLSIIIPAVLVALGDQLTKAWIARRIPLGHSRVIWPGFFALTHVRNAGAAFGILQFQAWLFILLGVAVTVAAVACWRTLRSQPLAVRIGLGLALGGTVGNLVDRLRLAGRVCDFLDFYHWPVFNLADTALVCGVGLILLAMASGPKKSTSG